MPNPFSEYGVSDAEFEAELNSAKVLEAKVELAEKAAAYWRRISPVDTGEYVDSIDVHVEGENVWVGSDDDKAEYIEYGTGGDSPTPEFSPRAKTQMRFSGEN